VNIGPRIYILYSNAHIIFINDIRLFSQVTLDDPIKNGDLLWVIRLVLPMAMFDDGVDPFLFLKRKIFIPLYNVLEAIVYDTNIEPFLSFFIA